MVKWFRQKDNRGETPRQRPRSVDVVTTKVDLAALTPDVSTFLGKSAYLQLVIFENLGRAIALAPTTDAKANLSRAAAYSLAKHHGLTDEIERHGFAPADLMEPNRVEIDQFQRLTQGADWFEALVTCHVTAGFLDDFFLLLAEGLPKETAARVAEVLNSESGESLLAAELLAAIDANPRLAARLAMWGRRLVGDTMLVARSALQLSTNQRSDAARIEPVFTELIASHTRRMDSLGLTA